MTKKSFKIKVSAAIGSVSGIFYSPAKPEYVMTFAHGAGAGMNNKFMEQAAIILADEGIATFRFNFPYMENGRKVPDTKPVCCAAISAAIEKAISLAPKLPVFAAGKSFGGRMSSTAASEGMIDDVKGIIFFGFPLHAPGKPGNERAEHLYKVKQPTLFLQGTRDSLASLDLLKPVCKKIGKKAQVFIVDGADHSFHVPKANKLNDTEVLKLLCGEIKKWMDKQ